jgi:hypothetical protein
LEKLVVQDFTVHGTKVTRPEFFSSLVFESTDGYRITVQYWKHGLKRDVTAKMGPTCERGALQR